MNIDAFILTGGRSSRMGQDKAKLQIGGRFLVERAAEIVREGLSPESVSLVAAAKEQFADVDNFGLPVICDIYQNKGAVGAVQAALAGATTEWAFVMACDLPLVSPDLIRRFATRVGDTCDTVVPVQADGRLQPLCAFYRVGPGLDFIEGVLSTDAPIPAMASIVEQLRPRIVQFDEFSDLPGSEDFFLNVNTPDDLEHARRLSVSAV
jgi:molybdopterin-guanine dinucleotide biosynthesis protein A